MKIRFYFYALLLSIFIIACKKEDPAPTESQKTICEQIGQLQENKEFNDRLDILYNSALNYNFEAAFLFYADNRNIYRYEYVEGELNRPSLSLTLNRKIDGVIHCHYKSLYPIFSIGDMKALYEIIDGQFIKESGTFNFGVVSAKGVAYLIKFSDFSKARDFLIESFKTSSASSRIEKQYKDAIDLNLKQNNMIVSGELSFLSIFGSKGMDLFKASIGDKKWVKIDIDSGNELVEIQCE